ncbi:hypothetical protein [Acuticoccus sp.]|uniref:hypothetical protein n=1 Tax=Acuticoccus sp. TaxID=1904378 RepID=UPI003B51E669
MVRSVLAVVCLALVLSGCNTAYNYFEEEPDPMEERPATAFGALLTMGGVVENRRPIEHQPRAPLALPSSTDQLPNPVDQSAAEAAVDFPEDHDVQRRRERIEASAAIAELDATLEKRGGRALPGEIPEQDGGLGQAPKESIAEMARDPFERLTRQEMKVTIKAGGQRTGMLADDGTAAPRASLIQPPSTFRTPAESAALPEPKEIENSEWARKRLYAKEEDPGARKIKQ